jgi:hypothetical protein
MTRKVNGKTPVERVLECLENVRPSGEGWSARCPAHNDRRNSLSVGKGDDGCVLLNCHAGCDVDDILAKLRLKRRDLFKLTKGRVVGDKSPNSAGLTLREYAAAKELSAKFLRRLGLTDIYLQNAPVVRIPYLDPNGNVLAARLRLSMKDEPRFVWKTGAKLLLYGLWRLKKKSKRKYLVLVEGESDCHTLWLHRFPALGLPGAATWKEDWAGHLDGFKRIYVVVEPDRGGESVLGWLANSKIRNRARLVTLAGVKDPSALYLSDPANFVQNMKAALKSATPWSKWERRETEAKIKAAWAECKHLARERDIPAAFVDALVRHGVAGEGRVCKLLCLVLTSRVLDMPVSAVLPGQSSGGKSFIVQSILDFFPAGAYHALTAMSERALAYSKEPLSHRFLVLYEGAALNGEFLNYIVRSLLSEGRIRYETVEKTRDGLKPRLIEREGPTGLILTTTAVRLHPENETRLIAIPISDSPAQTKRVFLAQADSANANGDSHLASKELRRWHALQEWIAVADNRVCIPYARPLAELMPPAAVRLRRDFKAILNLIKTHAILHQANRRRDKSGRIIAKLIDYRAVRKLVNDLVSEGVEKTVSKTIRQTVRAVVRICSEATEGETHAGGDVDGISVLEIAKALHIDRSSASRRVKQCLLGGYLKNLETARGRPHRLVSGDPLPTEKRVMPLTEEVRKKWKGSQ